MVPTSGAARRLAVLGVVAAMALPASAGVAEELQDLVELPLDLYDGLVAPLDDGLDRFVLDSAAIANDAAVDLIEGTDDLGATVTANAIGYVLWLPTQTDEVADVVPETVQGAGQRVNDGVAVSGGAIVGVLQDADDADGAVVDRTNAALAVAQDYVERRTISAVEYEAALLQPTPGLLLGSFHGFPDPRIPIVVVIPEENPDPNDGLGLLTYITDPQVVIDRSVAYAGELAAWPSQVHVDVEGHVADVVAVTDAEVTEAVDDTVATADALVAVLAS